MTNPITSEVEKHQRVIIGLSEYQTKRLLNLFKCGTLVNQTKVTRYVKAITLIVLQ